jgi:transposase
MAHLPQKIISERIDDVVLLLEVMKKMGLPEILIEQAVLTYRDEWIAERGFHRLKGASLSITPMFVQRDHQVTRLINLLSLALRLLTIIEFVVRRQLTIF